MIIILSDQVDGLLDIPQAFFGREEYSLKEMVAYLDGYIMAQLEFSGIDERNYVFRVKMYIKQNIDPSLDVSKHIIDVFDDLADDEKTKCNLLLDILKKLYSYKYMTPDFYRKYWDCNQDNTYVINISEISVISGFLSAVDYSETDFISNNFIQYYNEKIPKGIYNVKASLVKCGDGKYRIAAVKIVISEEIPLLFKMAIYDGQNISDLKENCFYGFNSNGFSLIADAQILKEFCEILKQYNGKYNDTSDYYYSASEYFYKFVLGKKLKDAHLKYPEYKVDFIDYVLPQTDHHLTFVRTGYGYGKYPVYFGYSPNGELCCVIAQFIFEP